MTNNQILILGFSIISVMTALGSAVVYIFKDKTVQPVVITKGLSDVSNVEILDGLKVGDEIIIEQVSNFKGKGSKKK